MEEKDKGERESRKALNEIERLRSPHASDKNRMMGLDFIIAELDRDLSLLGGEMLGIVSKQDGRALEEYLERHPEDRELLRGHSPIEQISGPKENDRARDGEALER